MEKPTLINHLIAIMLLPFLSVFIIPFLILMYSDWGWRENWSGNAGLVTNFFGVLVIIDGLVLLGYCVYQLHQYGFGTLAPWRPTKKLVETSVYTHVRNPMLIGVAITLMGEALLFRAGYLFIWCFVFIIGNTFYLAWIEEPGLYKQHGQVYLNYLRRVPRWIPKFPRRKKRTPNRTESFRGNRND